MKKIYATIIIVFICCQSNAQIDVGQFLLGGSLSYESNSVRSNPYKYRYSDLTFSPSAGVFVFNKLATGLRFSYDRHQQRTSERPFSNYRERLMSFSPFARYYLLNKNRPYNIFVDASFDFYKLKEKYLDEGYLEQEGSGYTLSGGPVFFVSRRLALELAFGYSKRYHLDEISLTRIYSSLGLQLHFPGEEIARQSNAQIHKGQLLVGGSISYKRERTDEYAYKISMNNFAFAPSVGIFLFERLATGVKLSFNASKWENTTSGDEAVRWHAYTVSPFVRYYFLPAEKPVDILTQVSYDYSKIIFRSPDGNIPNDGDGFSVSLGPVIFLNPQTALEFMLGYQNSISPSRGHLSTLFSSIGMQVHLGKGKAKKN